MYKRQLYNYNVKVTLINNYALIFNVKIIIFSISYI